MSSIRAVNITSSISVGERNTTNMTRPMWLPFVMWLTIMKKMNQETVRLIWDQIPVTGRPEVLFEGHWRSLCVDELPDEHTVLSNWPTVTCHQLGFIKGAQSVQWLRSSQKVENSTGYFYKNPKCENVVSKLQECQQKGGKCNQEHLVKLTCAANVRFGGSSIPGRGRAEYHDGSRWGTICDDVFARGGWPYIFCRELGFKGYPREVLYAIEDLHTSIGTGHIALMNPYCNSSNAETMQDCQTRPMPCQHQADVVVDCRDLTTTTIIPATTMPKTSTTKKPTTNPTTTEKPITKKNKRKSPSTTHFPTKPAYIIKQEILEEILDFNYPTKVLITLPPGVVEADERPTAYAIGGFGLFLFIFFLAAILLSDLPSFKRDICIMIRNIRFGYKRFKNYKRAQVV